MKLCMCIQEEVSTAGEYPRTKLQTIIDTGNGGESQMEASPEVVAAFLRGVADSISRPKYANHGVVGTQLS